MKNKTVKLKKGEYTNFKDEFIDNDVIILTGARGAGKSYPVAKYISGLLEQDETAKFVYMRIRNEELATFNGWCSDLNLSKLAGYPDTYNLLRGKPTRGDITLIGYDEDEKIISERIIGKCISLESSHTMKSGKYDDFVAIVFEEYTHLKMTSSNEETYVFNFLENVVSVFRERPKKIFLLCNNLKTIPLLERGIIQLKGEMFTSPIKIKIFRQGGNVTRNKFLDYLNGELYDEDDFKVNVDEFYIIYTNRNFVIKQHKIYTKKHYVTANKSNRRISYNELEYLTLKLFCQNSSNNEFYYQNSGVELDFIKEYTNLVREVAKFLSDSGTPFIVKL